ncbi:hypothetical protein JCM10207_001502 [Rhodosporidiobolus poonsookiae]
MGPNTKGQGKGNKKGRSKGATYASKRPVGGKGIFITTIRGKEARCVSEMYALLDEVADRLYPPERIEKMQAAREAQRLERLAQGGEDTGMGDDETQEGEDVEEKQEETAPAQAPAFADSDEDDEDDIGASIRKELEAMKGGRKAAPPKKGGDGKAKERPRFQSIQTDTECLCFIATAWPYDPVELTEALVSEVQETGVARTRFVQRLSPISFSCHSLSVEQVELQSSRHIEQAFTDWALANNKTSVTYAIEPSLRSHTAPLSRSLLLPLLGNQITKLSSAPTVSSVVPTRPILSVRADLKNPDLVLLPTVLKNVYGLSVVEGRLWKNKKFNLEAIAKDVRDRRAEEDKVDKEVSEAATQAEGAPVA